MADGRVGVWFTRLDNLGLGLANACSTADVTCVASMNDCHL